MLHDFAVSIATFITIMGSILAHDAQQLSTRVSTLLLPATATSISDASTAQTEPAAAATTDDPFHASAPADDPPPPPPAKQIELQPAAPPPAPSQSNGRVLGASAIAPSLPTPDVVTHDELSA